MQFIESCWHGWHVLFCSKAFTQRKRIDSAGFEIKSLGTRPVSNVSQIDHESDNRHCQKTKNTCRWNEVRNRTFWIPFWAFWACQGGESYMCWVCFGRLALPAPAAFLGHCCGHFAALHCRIAVLSLWFLTGRLTTFSSQGPRRGRAGIAGLCMRFGWFGLQNRPV